MPQTTENNWMVQDIQNKCKPTKSRKGNINIFLKIISRKTLLSLEDKKSLEKSAL